MVTSTTNLVRFQSDINDHIEEEYEFLNTWNGTRIVTQEITDSSATKSYLKKNNIHYFDFLFKFWKVYKDSNLSPSPGHVRGNHLQQPWRFRLQRHQCVVNDWQSKSTQRTNPSESTLPISCYLKKKYEISRDIQAEYPWQYYHQGRVILNSDWTYAVL